MFKLAIKDTVQVKVKFTIKDKGVDRLFAFSVDCIRLEQDVITERLEEKDKKVVEFMADVITGWDAAQRLVLLHDDTPAPWSPEALEALLKVPGVGNVIFTAYLKDVGATAKN